MDLPPPRGPHVLVEVAPLIPLVQGGAGRRAVALADLFFFTKGVGSTMGAFALAVAACAGVVRPAMWRDRRAVAAFVVAVAFALALVDHPTLLGWRLFWAALMIAGLIVAANPVIDSTLRAIDLGEIDAGRLVLWTVFGLIAWMALRPSFVCFRRRPALPGPLERPGVTVLSVGLSLALINLLFAVQNGLDIVFLWSGADQSDWRTWTWRGARRLEAAERQRPPGGLEIVGAYVPSSARS